MAAMNSDQDRTLRDDQDRLQVLESEKEALESRPHNGVSDVTRGVRLESEIEALEENITREKQRAVQGEG